MLQCRRMSASRCAARLAAAALGVGSLYRSGLFLLGASRVTDTDGPPVVWGALGLLCALPGAALLWFAAGRRFALWGDAVSGEASAVLRR